MYDLFFCLVVAAAKQYDCDKDYPQATIVIIKKAFDTHFDFTSLIDFNISYVEAIKSVTRCLNIQSMQ